MRVSRFLLKPFETILAKADHYLRMATLRGRVDLLRLSPILHVLLTHSLHVP